MLNKKPKVSVCIPNYNNGQFIGEAIQSVLNQSYGDFELIIVDNCSTDNSVTEINRFSDPRIKIYKNDKNIGFLKNWNKCISLVNGEYISLLHSDDKYEPDMIKREVEIFDSNPNVGLVFSPVKQIDSKGDCIGYSKSPFNSTRVIKGDDFFKELIMEDHVPTPSVMVRKECYDILGSFDEYVGPPCDWEMWLRVSLYYDVAFISEPLAHYRIHSGCGSFEVCSDLSWNISQYNLLEKTFSTIPIDKKDLLLLKPKSMRSFAKRIVRSSTRYLDNKNPKMLRQNIAFAFAIDESIVLYPGTWAMLFLSCISASLAANIVLLLRKLKKRYPKNPK